MNPNENPLIDKKIIYAGTNAANFTNGTKVFFHFQTRLCDNDKTIIDDSRKLGPGKPVELVLGKKFKLDVWEAILQKMAINEVAQFTVHKSLVVQYPFVSKTLRDVHKPKNERLRHCCGMMLQNEGVGYADLNSLQKNPVDLEFTIELLKVESPDDYEKESWQFNESEKLDMIPVLKDKGNNAFKNQDIKTATDLYATALGFLEQLMLKEKPNDIEWLELQKQKVPLLNNYSQCKLLQGDYYDVIEHCNSLLKIEPDNVKALYRRAKAHVGAWNPEQARSDFVRVSELDESLNGAIKKHLQELDEEIRIKQEQDKEKFKDIFSR